jgi:hypothetical protein
MLVIMLELIFTLPLGAEIVLVSDSWLFAVATRTVAAIDESLLSATSQFVVSASGAVVLLAMSALAS